MTDIRYIPKEYIRDHAQMAAWDLHPDIVYWCAIRLMAHATQGPYGNQIVPELNFIEALQRWEKDVGYPTITPFS